MKKKTLIILSSLILLLCAACGDSAPEEPALPNDYVNPPEVLQFHIGENSFRSSDSRLYLTGLDHEDAVSLAEAFPKMEHLYAVNLGNDEDSELSWEDIAMLEKAAPECRFEYTFHLYGEEFSLQDTALDLNHITIDDEGALVRQVMACMPELTYLDMDFCGVTDESMASIRDDFPNVKVVWRVWFGNNYTARTDVEKILASSPGLGGNLTVDNTQALKYCTDVKYLDVGHNEQLKDISFVAYMPKLEVAILAMLNFTDTSPLANCPNLEFLEIQTNQITDLSPLAGLTKLHHLNIGYNFGLSDISPLYGMTELERLWIGYFDPVPQEQVDKMQECAPNCVIDTTACDPHANNWRYDPAYESGFSPRYELLVKQFGYDTLDYALPWKDPKYYKSE